MNFNMDFLAAMLVTMGEDAVRRMLTIPGAVCNKKALQNHDNVAEMIQKRDDMVDAMIAFAKEYANVDFD